MGWICDLVGVASGLQVSAPHRCQAEIIMMTSPAATRYLLTADIERYVEGFIDKRSK